MNPVPVRAVASCEPRDAEVGELRRPVRAQQHVRRLHIAVDDPTGVGMGESVGQFRTEIGRSLGPERTVDQRLAEGPAVAPLEHEERTAVVLAVVEQGDDGGMVEGSEGDELALEALQVLDLDGAEQLDRDRETGLDVDGIVDIGHGAPPQQGAELPPAGDHLVGCRLSRSSRRTPYQAPASPFHGCRPN